MNTASSIQPTKASPSVGPSRWWLVILVCCGAQFVILATLAIIAPTIFGEIADRDAAGAAFGRSLRIMTTLSWPLVIVSSLAWLMLSLRLSDGSKQFKKYLFQGLSAIIFISHFSSWQLQSTMQELRSFGPRRARI